MKRRPAKQLVTGAFDIVRTVGLALPDVEVTTKYDGSPVLKVDGKRAAHQHLFCNNFCFATTSVARIGSFPLLQPVQVLVGADKERAA